MKQSLNRSSSKVKQFDLIFYRAKSLSIECTEERGGE